MEIIQMNSISNNGLYIYVKNSKNGKKKYFYKEKENNVI